jgi:DNA-binding transcriptional MerR regulator
MTEKDPSALKTIGEVSEELDVATHVLRFWEGKFPHLAPKKRRGRRYYKPEDVVELRQIKSLLYDKGYTIKGVQKFLKEQKESSHNDNHTAEEVTVKTDKDLFGNESTTAATEDSRNNSGLSETEVKKLKKILQGMFNLRDFLQQKPLM